MKRLLFIISLLTVLSVQSHAQEYINAIGFRGGISQGLTFKHYISRTNALEGILATRWNGFYLTGLYEVHTEAFDTQGLYFYYGGGAHAGFWDSNANPWFDDGTSNVVIGIDGIIGLEYVFQQIPFNLSLDWKPAFNLIGVTNFWGSDLAISFRFYFG